jgi:hypothetical protein
MPRHAQTLRKGNIIQRRYSVKHYFDIFKSATIRIRLYQTAGITHAHDGKTTGTGRQRFHGHTVRPVHDSRRRYNRVTPDYQWRNRRGQRCGRNQRPEQTQGASPETHRPPRRGHRCGGTSPEVQEPTILKQVFPYRFYPVTYDIMCLLRAKCTVDLTSMSTQNKTYFCIINILFDRVMQTVIFR